MTDPSEPLELFKLRLNAELVVHGGARGVLSVLALLRLLAGLPWPP